MFKTIMACAMLLPGLAGGALAQEQQTLIPGDFSSTVALTSDYTFRGISQTDENPAIQGSFDYAHDSGFHAGVWGSNVDFNDGDEATIELDLTAGFGGEIQGIAWDVTGIYYAYPGADDDLNYDYAEAMLTLGYDFGVASAEGLVAYSPSFFADSGDAIYYAANASVPLPYGLSLDGHVGRQEIDDNDAFGLPDYTDWSVGLGLGFEGFDFAVAYVDTDLEDDECGDLCDERVVFSVFRTF